jgi:hypothetical protein
MSEIEWQIVEVPKAVAENENVAEEFFSNADILSEASGLVRESIQNSLDEVLDTTKPVQMVFTIGTQLPAIANRYFEKLYRHIKKSGLREVPNFDESSKFLVIEDFNTLGLDGPTSSASPTDEELEAQKKIDRAIRIKFSFWFFAWKTGASNKTSGNRGSWGIGKIVFPRASRIKSYLVLSVRRPQNSPDGNPSIMFGKSILKYRQLDGKRYLPECQWMIQDSEGLPIPSSDAAEQLKFIQDWKLARTPGEMGTSIVVPFCRDEMSANNLIQSIIRDYFISILGGQLECTVRDENGLETRINKSTLMNLIEDFQGGNLPRGTRSAEELKALCEMYLAHENAKTTKVTIPLHTTTPNDWAEIEFSEEDAERITEAYNSGQIIELTVMTAIPAMTDPKKDPSEDSYTVLLKKVLDMRSSTVFCREGILIPSANTSSSFQNCISMVIIGKMTSAGEVDNSLANLLKNAEGPSHDRWSPDAMNFRGRYTPKYKAEGVIRWVKTSAERCLRLIQGAETEEDDVTLSVYFPFSDDTGAEPGVAKVVLSGVRDPGDPDRAVFTWRADGFTPVSYVLKRLAPTPGDIENGSEARGTTSTSLDDGPSAVYRFQMEMSDGTKTILSNVVEIRPDTPTPDPKVKARIQINKTATGFEIVALAGEKLPANYQFTVTAAYRSRGSSSVNKWTLEDFLLDDQMAKVKLKGLKITESAKNYCRFEVTDADIYAEWRDFDTLRDLVVEAVEDN